MRRCEETGVTRVKRSSRAVLTYGGNGGGLVDGE